MSTYAYYDDNQVMFTIDNCCCCTEFIVTLLMFADSNMLAYYHESLMMEVIEIKDTGDDVTLENDFYPAKYSQARLMSGSEEIENITSCPGEASTIFQSIVTSDTYKKNYE